MLIFSGTANVSLTNEIAKYLGVGVSDAEIGKFEDGETRVRIKTNVRGKDIFVVQPTCPPVNDTLMELLIVIDGLKRASAKRITAVLPYYGYGRNDEVWGSQMSITAKLVADLITKAGPDRLLTLDLHSGQIQGFFSFPVDSLKPDPVFLNYLREVFENELSNVVIMAPNAVAVKRASRIAKRLNTKMALIDERAENEFYIVGDILENVVIIKDIIDTGNSIIGALETLRNNGVKKIFVVCTHAILSGDCIKKINDSSITQLVVTNSTRQSQQENLIEKCPKIKVLNIAPLVGEAIRRIHNEESVSSLFRYE